MKMKNFEKYSPKESFELIYDEKLIKEVFNSLCNSDSNAFIRLFLNSDEKSEFRLARICILLALLDGFIIGKLAKDLDEYCDNIVKDDVKLADAFILFELKQIGGKY